MLLEADGTEGIFLADFPIREMREYRRREVHGNAYRRPKKYKILLAEDVLFPFYRPEARR